MSQSDVQNILEGIRIGNQRQESAQQNQIQQQQLEQQQQAEADRHQQAQDELSQRQTQFDVTMKAAQALHKLQILKEQQQLAQSPQAIATLPGAQIVNTRKTPTGETYNTWNVPGIDQPFEAPDQTTYNKQQATNWQQQNQPMIDMQKQAQQNQLAERLMQTQMQVDQRAEAAREHNDTMQAVMAGNNATKELIARLGMGMTQDQQLDPDAAAAMVKSIADGTNSAKDIMSQFPATKAGKIQAQMVIGTAMKHGFVPLTDNQKSSLGQLEEAGSSIFPKYQQLVNGKDDLGNPLGFTDVHRITQEISGQLPNIVRGISGVGNQRLNVPEINTTWKGYLPSEMAAQVGMNSYNAKKYLSFKNDFQTKLDQAIRGLPPAQQSAIRNRLYSKFGFSPTAQPNQSQQMPQVQGQPARQTQMPAGGVDWSKATLDQLRQGLQ